MSSSKARYSEAERRGRGPQVVTDIGVKGRRTGLEIHDTTRDEDGMENLSAFFSPATAKKKAQYAASASGSLFDSTRSSARRAGSTSRPSTASGEQEMELEASSAQEVTATLTARRQSQAASAAAILARHSQSPTKTHLNSPALRVRNAVSNPASPALRDPKRPASANLLARVARKLDFRSGNLDVDDDEAEEEEPVRVVMGSPRRVKQVLDARRRSKSPAAAPTSAAAADRRRRLAALDQATEEDQEPMEMDADDGMGPGTGGGVESDDAPDPVNGPSLADLQGESFQDLVQPDPLPNAQNDDVRYDVQYDPPDDTEPMFNDFIDDEAGDDMQGGDDDNEDQQVAIREEEEEELADADDEEPRASNKKKGGKSRKAVTDDEDEDAGSASDAPPARKRGRAAKKASPKKDKKKTAAPGRHASLSPSRAASRTRDGRTQSPQREWREPITHEESNSDQDNEEGVRRSTRVKVPPLAFWRGEKMVFGRGSRRKSAGGTLGLALPEVKEIIHVELIEGEQQVRRSRAGSKGRANAKKKRRNGRVKEESSASEQEDGDEEEEHIVVEAHVRAFENPDELVKKVLAIPQAMYDPRPVVGQGIFFQKTLSEEPHFAAGVLDIPIGEGKPVKPSKQNTMFFFIYTGYVQVKIHDVVFKLRKGGQFTVPRGNFYEIVNVGTKDARLFFSQSTDTLANAQVSQPKRR